MQMIIIGGTEAEKVLKDLAETAARPENHWHGPKDTKHYSLFRRDIDVRNVLDDTTKKYHVIFTITCGESAEVVNGKVVPTGDLKIRHTTIGCEFGKEEPDIFAVFTICKFLGYEGGIEEWRVTHHPEDKKSIVVFQPIPNEKATRA